MNVFNQTVWQIKRIFPPKFEFDLLYCGTYFPAAKSRTSLAAFVSSPGLPRKPNAPSHSISRSVHGPTCNHHF